MCYLYCIKWKRCGTAAFGARKLQPIALRLSRQDKQMIAEFAPLNPNLDEDSKLQAPTIFDGLRCLTDLYKTSETPIFLGGLFAYDLVANFIPMENIVLHNDGLSCPDYVFYLAENLLILDHQRQQAQLQTFCFNQNTLSATEQSAVQITQKLQKIEPHLTIQPASTEVSVNIEDEPFKDIIRRLKHHINIGDVFQIVPSRRFSWLVRIALLLIVN